MEIGPVVSDKKIFKVFYIDNKGKISPAPWRPCFLMNRNGLNNLGRGSPKEHFCKIIWKSVQWFLTRRFFKFLVKKSIFSSCDLDMQWFLIVLGFNDTSTHEGHFVSSPREREKRDRRESRGDEREGQGRKRNRKESEETEEIKTFPLYPYPLQG